MVSRNHPLLFEIDLIIVQIVTPQSSRIYALPESSDQITVICKVCGTRMSADVDLVGTKIVCPDCFTKNVIPPPDKKQLANPSADDDEFEYKLAEGSDQPALESEPMVSLICTTCHSLLHAPEKDIGKKIQCHDCDGWNVVPRPRKTKRVNAPALDPAENMGIAEAADTADQNRQDYAQRKLEEAHEELQRIEDEKPKMIDENTSLIGGVLFFPLYPNVIPVWAGLAVGMFFVGAMIETINFFMDSGGHSMILSAAIAALGGMATITLMGTFASKLLAVVEYTSSGQIDVEEFPQSDLMERAYALIIILNALALSFLPEIFGGSLGIRGLLGGITATFVFPVLLLSLLDSGSLWVPISGMVYGSIVKIPGKWVLFWLCSFVVLVSALAISLFLGAMNNLLISLLVASIVNAFALILYSRMLGWMAWHIGLIPIELDDDDDEDDDDESNATWDN